MVAQKVLQTSCKDDAANPEPKLETTDTKLFVPVIALSTQDNVKLFKKL